MNEITTCIHKSKDELVEDQKPDVLGRQVFIKGENLSARVYCKVVDCTGYCLVQAIAGKNDVYTEVVGSNVGVCVEGN